MTVEMQKYILCYGDSNTWGWPPSGWGRHPQDQRWPGVLELTLGDGYHIIEAGQPGRAVKSGFGDPDEEHRELYQCLNSSQQIDLVILMLGINDLFIRPSDSADDVASNLGAIVLRIETFGDGTDSNTPLILIVSPPYLEQDTESQFAMFDGQLVQKSKQLGGHYEQLANLHSCEYFDAATAIRSSLVDGVHLDADAHVALGQALAPVCREILK
jgi:lysophospholipase L1-like esterase